jgi:hypothetical protein
MATTTNFGWETPDDTDLVKDGALAMRTLGNAIDTSLVDLKGGTTGQVLSKTSNTDMDFTWVTSDDANAIQNAIVDAKGDLIAASAADTPARLAVGNNGETLVADSSTSTGLRWQGSQAAGKNAVINGAFDIWQRGTSITAASAYNADRWYKGANSVVTISRQTTSDTTNLPFIQYCARVQRNSGQTSTTFVDIGSPIETANAINYAGKAITLSYYARAGANFSASSSSMVTRLYTGTGTDQNVFSGYTGSATPIDTTVTLTTTWQRFQHTITLGATVTEFTPYFGFTPVGTAGAADFFEITGVQVEVGSVATQFTRAGGTLAGELAACQRYYQRVGDSLYGIIRGGTGDSADTDYSSYTNLTTMRSAPTGTKVGTWATFNTNQPTVQAATTKTFSLACGITSATSVQYYFHSDTSNYIELSAEL